MVLLACASQMTFPLRGANCGLTGTQPNDIPESTNFAGVVGFNDYG